MSDRLKVSLTICGPLLVLLTAMLDARLSAILAVTALLVFGIWLVIDLRHRNRAADIDSKASHDSLLYYSGKWPRSGI